MMLSRLDSVDGEDASTTSTTIESIPFSSSDMVRGEYGSKHTVNSIVEYWGVASRGKRVLPVACVWSLRLQGDTLLQSLQGVSVGKKEGRRGLTRSY